jgi:nucleotide-binding universal stress UspA family protein
LGYWFLRWVLLAGAICVKGDDRMPSPLGVFIALGFVVVLGTTLFWMLRLPRPMAQEVARAVFSVQATRCIIVPILDLFYTERAVELACRMGKQQNAAIILAYIIEVPRLVALDSPASPEVEDRAQQALRHAQTIVERHGLKATATSVHAREADEGISQMVHKYGGDIVVLGVQAVERHLPSIFTRTADALMRRPPCEVLIDSMPG